MFAAVGLRERLAAVNVIQARFRELLYRLVAVLTAWASRSVLITAEFENSYIDLRFNPHVTAFLTEGRGPT